MSSSTISTKIQQLLERVLLISVEKLETLAEIGDLASFETELRALGNEFLTKTAEVILTEVSEKIAPSLSKAGSLKGLGRYEKRSLKIRLFTGQTIQVPSLYARKKPLNYTGKRHLLALHWGIHKQCSPCYLSQICSISMLVPSFELAHQLLDIQGISYDSESLRKLVLSVSDTCKSHQATLTKKPNESLAGKRVVISLDGGRTRCRQSTNTRNKAGNETFTTNWNEPKMFVISTLNEEGQTEKENVIYGTMFGVEDIFDLLASHLTVLDITMAKSIQIIADGAPWIWNRTQELLLNLGVAAEKITEALDYYHAAQHLSDLLKQLPKRKVKKENLITLMKNLLWKGDIDEIVSQFNQLFTKKTKVIERDIHYFTKHKNRMQYAHFQQHKILLGSGIMESGIRRVINLRFKNSSSFWVQQNVEGLFFLRSSFLAGRWDNVMNNFINLCKGHI